MVEWVSLKLAKEEVGKTAASPVRKNSPYRDALQGEANIEDDNMSEDSMSSDSGIYEEDDFIAVSDSEDEGEDDEKCPTLRFSAAEKAAF